MRLTLKLVVSLVIGIAVVAFLFAYLQVRGVARALQQQMEREVARTADNIGEAMRPALDSGSRLELERLALRYESRDHLAGVAIYDPAGKTLSKTVRTDDDLARRAISQASDAHPKDGVGTFFNLKGSILAYVLPIQRDGKPLGRLLIEYDTAPFRGQGEHQWRDTFLRALAQVGLIAVVILLIIRWSIFGPMARTTQWMRDVRRGNLFRRPRPKSGDPLSPLEQEVSSLMKSLETARAAAKQEAQLRFAAESLWTAERLRVHIRGKLQQNPLIVVSNREPYIHNRRGSAVEVSQPASGLVTALEPILCACNGTWIAHGSGDADREAVNSHDSLRVPPDQPEYTLRRVWLTKEEEEGYYFGFANEGLWPLCHIAHTRPLFRARDWACYQAANAKFAAAVLEEMAGVEEPIVLVQDYHFALLPRLIKEARPDARVAIFWHIPWPNPEAVRICPWQSELLDGLLGADLIGFHIQAHSNNFLDTVERAIEAKVEWERFSVLRRGHLTQVSAFPISVEFPEAPRAQETRKSPYVLRSEILKGLGLNARFLGIGVDRMDYTKGILERFAGIERFFEKWPAYREKFTFVQIGAPSRTHIKRYHDLVGEVEEEAERINWKFQTSNWKPIVLRNKHHSHDEIEPYYRAADVCLVTSLHDGMNLVAKEFVAARDDEEGALILSEFTGAARELRDAFIVNPYDTEQIAEAIHFALEMDATERQERMRRMRAVVRDHNVYRWAGNLIAVLSEIRIEKAEPAAGTVIGA
ncbi:MAG TPA: trehalose-6-phosphate synthase [Candidatus Acidoferrales bacterium]|nr:trehalose-6-phosphate synthase [Candidatus Acidoferrales bacterium]